MLGSAVIQSPSSFPLSLHPFSFPRKQKYPSHTRCFFFSSTRPETVFPRPFRRSLVSESTPEPIGFTPPSSPEDGLEEPKPAPDPDSVSGDDGGDGSFEIEIEKLEKKNGRRIRARIRVEADLETVWSVLTDYDGLADFIPNLAVSQLIEKKDKFARLYQVGQQDLALGLKFNANGVLDCYERDLEILPFGRRRDIEFKMVEGDFHTFEGKWSIEQIDNDMCKDEETMEGKGFQTTLLYFVELEPKLWIPVRLLEGRVCREIKINLQCIREEAQRVQEVGHEALPTWP
ncbi:uncharacterized protein LOC113463225 isoform X1 [Phoenix dactylifera]|uniref:Uncharacterized protein LOC113463225 isoform X1 n=1 Tax=Phoenix dactylifera TaxID=42345 RepID=A0A8B8J8F7_PHODC|nr:uncharacterized protein LOC113463225 isoform X1 [Phoenix dactylifera]